LFALTHMFWRLWFVFVSFSFSNKAIPAIIPLLETCSVAPLMSDYWLMTVGELFYSTSASSFSLSTWDGLPTLENDLHISLAPSPSSTYLTLSWSELVTDFLWLNVGSPLASYKHFNIGGNFFSKNASTLFSGVFSRTSSS
jgi:hypothetical protein